MLYNKVSGTQTLNANEKIQNHKNMLHKRANLKSDFCSSDIIRANELQIFGTGIDKLLDLGVTKCTTFNIVTS